ncbi:Lrp/AsnC family transcriptional regulator [Pseudomonas panipatensis]|uniref:Lrp/AsnC family transcriptional regulator, leucine-responsive regulatory protein n=1 Tax=Pseudomonas panipatensis TaxID=428992 RepID=A0A1G8HFL4_9PSED|nr:Lrp/AsnC family transcriptional regulator [Pseudomonas panipatensis]SDI05433.1 Lrp/AsnC family transcriptional regulator, leucine-responsive regulatory protein [Pseudomonas panipatensis]SMP57979.1 transcriptional regulator, AsnC family [Pseudomonas panipatensis]
MDKYDRALIAALLENGRLSFAELARRINLSPPAVADRVAKLEAEGVITGYHASVDLSRLGRPIQCIIELRLNDHRGARVLERLAEIPQIIDCHRVTGDFCVILKVAVANTEELEELIDRLAQYGASKTSLVLSSPFSGRLDATLLGNGKPQGA